MLERGRAQLVPLLPGRGPFPCPTALLPQLLPLPLQLLLASCTKGEQGRSQECCRAVGPLMRPLSCRPSLEYSSVPKVAARSGSIPTPPPHTCPCPGSHGRAQLYPKCHCQPLAQLCKAPWQPQALFCAPGQDQPAITPGLLRCLHQGTSPHGDDPAPHVLCCAL